MNNYITLDGGTTNTRVSLYSNGKILKSLKFGIGSKDSIDGNSALKTAVKNAIHTLLDEFSLKSSDISGILASGMITSEFGLYEVKHIKAPAGIKELKNGIKRIVLSDISEIPFYFIPGIIFGGSDPITTDMMRGEETEIMGLLKPEYENFAFLLPGSHSKLITFGENGRIDTLKTFLTGEMISALALNTILKATVNLNNDSYDSKFLNLGYDTAENYGINQALFKTRILGNIFDKSSLQCYSYFLGAVLYGEIENIKKCVKSGIVIGGKGVLKKPEAELLKKKTDLKVITLSDSDTENCVCFGAVKIFEY